MEARDITNITNILYRTVMNTGLDFVKEEYDTMLKLIVNNPEFCSKWVSDPKVRAHLKMKEKLMLLENFNVDILINNQYFTYCSKTELMKVLQRVDRKSSIKEIINQTNQTHINVNEIKDQDKKQYIEALLVARKLSS